MAENALEIELREDAGKGVARKLRAAGRIPGICYANKEPALAVSLDPAALKRLIADSDAGMNTLIDLKATGTAYDGRLVLIKEIQTDPVSGQYLHADLYAMDLEHTIDKLRSRLQAYEDADNGQY